MITITESSVSEPYAGIRSMADRIKSIALDARIFLDHTQSGVEILVTTERRNDDIVGIVTEFGRKEAPNLLNSKVQSLIVNYQTGQLYQIHDKAEMHV